MNLANAALATTAMRLLKQIAKDIHEIKELLRDR